MRDEFLSKGNVQKCRKIIISLKDLTFPVVINKIQNYLNDRGTKIAVYAENTVIFTRATFVSMQKLFKSQAD